MSLLSELAELCRTKTTPTTANRKTESISYDLPVVIHVSIPNGCDYTCKDAVPKNITSFEELLLHEYGEKGSPAREEFEAKANTFYLKKVEAIPITKNGYL